MEIAPEVTNLRAEETDGAYRAVYTVEVQPRESVEGDFPRAAVEVQAVIPWDWECTPSLGERVPYLGEPLEIFIDAEGNVALWDFVLPRSSRGLTFDGWQRSANRTSARDVRDNRPPDGHPAGPLSGSD